MHERKLEAAKAALLAALHFFHALHHLLHFLKLLQKLVDVLHTGAAAHSYALSAAAVDELCICPLLGSHGQDNRLYATHFLAIEVNVLVLQGILYLASTFTSHTSLNTMLFMVR